MDRYIALLITDDQIRSQRKLKSMFLKLVLTAVIVLFLAVIAFNFNAVNQAIVALDEQTEPA